MKNIKNKIKSEVLDNESHLLNINDLIKYIKPNSTLCSVISHIEDKILFLIDSDLIDINEISKYVSIIIMEMYSQKSLVPDLSCEDVAPILTIDFGDDFGNSITPEGDIFI